MSLEASFCNELTSHPEIAPCITYWDKHMGSEGASVPLDALPYGAIPALRKMGFQNLYAHQAEAISAIGSRKNVIITTGTSSGKSLCYQLPILEEVIKNAQSTALLLFPTKALTHDQLYAVKTLETAIAPGLSVTAVYDGDTPHAERQAIRKKARILLTNPDMVNVALLPYHTNWAAFFQNLKFIVIDELHHYRGVFGSHFCNIIRRLERICAFYGASPQFIMTSATIGNPQELAERLIEKPVVVISKDATPRAEADTLLYNPPLVSADLGIREGLLTSTLKLGSYLLERDVQTLVFCRSRRFVELVVRELRNRVPGFATQIRGYRSGYLKNERREIERGLKDRSLLLVAATNALELGVDIGGVDAVLIAGYPGSISSIRQMSGRAGRQKTRSLAMLIASMSPLDQYFTRFPDALFGKPIENALVDPNNPLILLPHLRAAAFEYPFELGARFGNLTLSDTETYLDFLTEQNYLQRKQNKYFYLTDTFPASQFSIRNTASTNIVLQAEMDERQTTIGEVDFNSGLWMCHPGAIYLHDGNEYHVDSLDLEKNIANLSVFRGSYRTEPVKSEDIAIDEVQLEKSHPYYTLKYGSVEITSTVTGFKKIDNNTGEVLGLESLNLPPTALNTTGFWVTLNAQCIGILKSENKWFGQSNEYGPDWKSIRERVLARDLHTCQSCGKKESLIPFHVHHKVPFKAFASAEHANVLSNLVTLCPDCHHLAEVNVKIRNCLSGLRYCLANLAPLLVLCDPEDIGSFSDPQAPFEDQLPVVLIHDTVPGGIGLSQSLYERFDQLIGRCVQLVSTCPCESGCPSCVGPDFENGLGGKSETLYLLTMLKGQDA
jgi:DEAD/DEAH box helicase domain-containing protein